MECIKRQAYWRPRLREWIAEQEVACETGSLGALGAGRAIALRRGPALPRDKGVMATVRSWVHIKGTANKIGRAHV